jgi:hypothetical protein
VEAAAERPEFSLTPYFSIHTKLDPQFRIGICFKRKNHRAHRGKNEEFNAKDAKQTQRPRRLYKSRICCSERPV